MVDEELGPEMNDDSVEKQRVLLELHDKLAVAEKEAERGEGQDFFEVAAELRRRITGRI